MISPHPAPTVFVCFLLNRLLFTWWEGDGWNRFLLTATQHELPHLRDVEGQSNFPHAVVEDHLPQNGHQHKRCPFRSVFRRAPWLTWSPLILERPVVETESLKRFSLPHRFPSRRGVHWAQRGLLGKRTFPWKSSPLCPPPILLLKEQQMVMLNQNGVPILGWSGSLHHPIGA